MHELWRTIALAPAEESHKMHDRAAVVHHGAPVLRSSYRWCAVSSSPSALAPTTGMAGASLGCPRLRPFRLGDDDVSMTSRRCGGGEFFCGTACWAHTTWASSLVAYTLFPRWAAWGAAPPRHGVPIAGGACCPVVCATARCGHRIPVGYARFAPPAVTPAIAVTPRNNPCVTCVTCVTRRMYVCLGGGERGPKFH